MNCKNIYYRLKSIDESGMFIEKKVIQKINTLLKGLRDYWREDNQDLEGKPEIKKKVDFEKELDSYKKPLKLENGVWSFTK